MPRIIVMMRWKPINLYQAAGSFSPRSVNPPAKLKLKRAYHRDANTHFHQIGLRSPETSSTSINRFRKMISVAPRIRLLKKMNMP